MKKLAGYSLACALLTLFMTAGIHKEGFISFMAIFLISSVLTGLTWLAVWLIVD